MEGEINRILEILESAKDKSGCVPMVLVRQALKKLEQRWTPCSERLPEKNGRYIVTNSMWGAFETEIKVFFDGKWYYPGSNPIAWMPLPESYRREQ